MVGSGMYRGNRFTVPTSVSNMSVLTWPKLGQDFLDLLRTDRLKAEKMLSEVSGEDFHRLFWYCMKEHDLSLDLFYDAPCFVLTYRSVSGSNVISACQEQRLDFFQRLLTRTDVDLSLYPTLLKDSYRCKNEKLFLMLLASKRFESQVDVSLFQLLMNRACSNETIFAQIYSRVESSRRSTLLIEACRARCLVAVKVILRDPTVDVNVNDGEPLMYSVMGGDTFAELLRDPRTDLSVREGKILAIVIQYSEAERRPKYIRLLLDDARYDVKSVIYECLDAAIEHTLRVLGDRKYEFRTNIVELLLNDPRFQVDFVSLARMLEKIEMRDYRSHQRKLVRIFTDVICGPR